MCATNSTVQLTLLFYTGGVQLMLV